MIAKEMHLINLISLYKKQERVMNLILNLDHNTKMNTPIFYLFPFTMDNGDNLYENGKFHLIFIKLTYEYKTVNPKIFRGVLNITESDNKLGISIIKELKNITLDQIKDIVESQLNQFNDFCKNASNEDLDLVDKLSKNPNMLKESILKYHLLEDKPIKIIDYYLTEDMEFYIIQGEIEAINDSGYVEILLQKNNIKINDTIILMGENKEKYECQVSSIDLGFSKFEILNKYIKIIEYAKPRCRELLEEAYAGEQVTLKIKTRKYSDNDIFKHTGYDYFYNLYEENEDLDSYHEYILSNDIDFNLNATRAFSTISSYSTNSFLECVQKIDSDSLIGIVMSRYNNYKEENYNVQIGLGPNGAIEFIGAILLNQYIKSRSIMHNIHEDNEVGYRCESIIMKVFQNNLSGLQFSNMMDDIINNSFLDYSEWSAVYRHLRDIHGELISRLEFAQIGTSHLDNISNRKTK